MSKAGRRIYSCSVEEKEGYIKVTASDKNPFISTQLVKIITKKLQSRIIKLRTDKIKEQLKIVTLMNKFI